MRKIAIGAALSGALALTAFGLSGAQADETVVQKRNDVQLKPFAADRGGVSTRDASVGDTQITNVTVNGGKNIAVGTTNAKTFTVSLTATDPSGIKGAYIGIWHGSNIDDYEQWFNPDQEASCTAVNTTTATCKQTITILPHDDVNAWLWNSLAGTWNVNAFAAANDGDYIDVDSYKTTKVQRYSRLSVNASPEPVTRGADLVVRGQLDRASWADFKYHGYATQYSDLEFRKASASTYTKVKSILGNSTGGLKKTLDASTDGYWRWNFKGTGTTMPIKAAGDYVNVR